jgi:hypothetical protein
MRLERRGNQPQDQRVDLNEYPSLGRLARLSAQLAAQSARVAAIVDTQFDQVERLFRAAVGPDWQEVERAVHELANQPPDRENSAVIRSASKVRDALRADPTGAKAARPLVKLLDACRAAKRSGS